MQEKQLRYDFNSLLEQYVTQKTNIEVSKEIVQNISLKYEQGMTSILELTNANNDYLKAEADYISVALQLLNADLALRKINNNL